MHPFAISDTNPNELYGVRACSFAGQQKSPDCAGPWFVVPTQHVRVANPHAPHVAVCAGHLHTALEATGFKTPTVREKAPPRPRNARRGAQPAEVLSL